MQGGGVLNRRSAMEAQRVGQKVPRKGHLGGKREQEKPERGRASMGEGVT